MGISVELVALDSVLAVSRVVITKGQQTMAKVVITYEYEPNMEHYPSGTETAVEAMQLDVERVQNGNVYWDEFLDGTGKLTVEVVE